MHANAMGGRRTRAGRHPNPETPPTRASGEIRSTATFPEHRSVKTFSRWALVRLVCRQAPLSPIGRPMI